MEPLLSKEPTVAELCQEVLPFIFMSLKTNKRVVSQSEASLRPSVFWHLLHVELSVFYNHFLQGCDFECCVWENSAVVWANTGPKLYLKTIK